MKMFYEDDYPDWVDDLAKEYNVEVSKDYIIDRLEGGNAEDHIGNIYCMQVFEQVKVNICVEYGNDIARLITWYINAMDTHLYFDDIPCETKDDIDVQINAYLEEIE